MTVAIEMGHTTAGAPATLDLEELLATRLLVQGNSGSGKFHLMAAKSAALEIRPEAVEPPLSAEELAARRERMDRILRAVMAEPDAGFRAVGVLYQEFVVRCRIEGLGSAVPDLADFRRMLTRPRRTRLRYGRKRRVAGSLGPRLGDPNAEELTAEQGCSSSAL